jgi:predicted outer membrane repeat protein
LWLLKISGITRPEFVEGRWFRQVQPTLPRDTFDLTKKEISMRSKVVITGLYFLGFCFAVYALFWSPLTGQASGGACNVPSGSYPTIQSAVNDTNCQTVELSPQNYNENVVVNRSVTVNGSSPATTIVNGQLLQRVFRIGASSTVTITNLTMTNGQGGIYNQGDLYLENVVIDQNYTSAGAGIFNVGTMTMISTTVVQNETQGSEERLAGGIYNDGRIYIEHSLIKDNESDSLGGGLLNNTEGSLTIYDSVIESNMARLGGGLYNIGNITVTNSAIISNTATNSDGGGVAQYGGILFMNNVTLSGNAAATSGGALSILGGSTHRFLTHVTMHNNSAGSGGALYANQNVQLVNSVIGLNPNAASNCLGTVISLGNNLDGGTSCGLSQPTDISGQNPFLEDLTSDGWQYTHPPFGISFLIDAAATSFCPSADQRGVSRPLDGDGDGNSLCDIGAHEYDGPIPDLTYLFLPLLKR